MTFNHEDNNIKIFSVCLSASERVEVAVAIVLNHVLCHPEKAKTHAIVLHIATSSVLF